MSIRCARPTWSRSAPSVTTARAKGCQPACVEVCPSQARIFGDQDDPNSPIAKVLKAQKSFRLQEDKGTKPNVHYVGKYSARG